MSGVGCRVKGVGCRVKGVGCMPPILGKVIRTGTIGTPAGGDFTPCNRCWCGIRTTRPSNTRSCARCSSSSGRSSAYTSSWCVSSPCSPFLCLAGFFIMHLFYVVKVLLGRSLKLSPSESRFKLKPKADIATSSAEQPSLLLVARD